MLKNKWRNFKLLNQLVWEYNGWVYIFIILNIILNGVMPFLQILISSQVIAWLLAGVTGETFLQNLLLWIIPISIGMFAQKVIQVILDQDNAEFRLEMGNRVTLKQATKDFDLTVGKEASKLYYKAMLLSDYDQTLFGRVFKEWSTLGSSLVAIALYVGTLAQLELQFLILIALLLIGLTLFKFFQLKISKQVYEDKAKNGKQINYIKSMMGDQRIAKDVRMYQMKDWFDSINGKLYEEFHSTRQPELKIARAEGVFVNVGLLILTGMAYFRSLEQIQAGEIPVSQFVLYVGLITLVTNTMMQLIKIIAQFNQSLEEMNYYYDFMNQTPAFNHEKGMELPDKDEPLTIELRNVSYTYPNNDEATIQNLNLTLKPKEKLAIVGENGAGKTTLIKLILGLLKPDEGDIFINGDSQNAFNIEDYYELFAPVFQDNYLFTYSIKDTVIQGMEYSEEKYQNVLELSGMADIIKGLPDGDETKIVRQVYFDAVTLSGGQMQKLKLAQALYKNAPVLVLDEPTAALDPISEYEVYQDYLKFSEEKISLFISHRLASTRFCDRIIYLNHGTIIEEGTHDELLQDGNGYAKLFETQAYYYREELAIVEDVIIEQGGVI